jgi:uncharacterized protein (DUF779 family)
MGSNASRVDATDEARTLIRSLKEQHGELLFHQSGGCCDGSSPMCYPRDEFKIGQRDVLLGEIEGCPVYIGGQQYDKWKHTHLTLDVVPGRGAGFSLEAPEGMRFLTRSRLFTDDERARLVEPHRGPTERSEP